MLVSLFQALPLLPLSCPAPLPQMLLLPPNSSTPPRCSPFHFQSFPLLLAFPWKSFCQFNQVANNAIVSPSSALTIQSIVVVVTVVALVVAIEVVDVEVVVVVVVEVVFGNFLHFSKCYNPPSFATPLLSLPCLCLHQAPPLLQIPFPIFYFALKWQILPSSLLQAPIILPALSCNSFIKVWTKFNPPSSATLPLPCLSMLCSTSALLCPNISSLPLCFSTLLCLECSKSSNQPCWCKHSTTNSLSPQISSAKNAQLVRTILQTSQTDSLSLQTMPVPIYAQLIRTKSANQQFSFFIQISHFSAHFRYLSKRKIGQTQSANQ